MRTLCTLLVIVLFVSCASVNIDDKTDTSITVRERFDPSKLSDKSEMTLVPDSIAVVSNKGRR